MRKLRVKILDAGSEEILVPTGISTPHGKVAGLTVTGARITQTVSEPTLALTSCLIKPERDTLEICYNIKPAMADSPYPEAAFIPNNHPVWTASHELAQASKSLAQEAGGGIKGIEALVAEAENRFVYDHPDKRFNDGTNAVPYIACGTEAGSCIDINTYLVASLRAAGYEAAYIYGYFFPRSRCGMTNDMHCWVITRHEGQILEWDIAHHKKADLGPTKASPNPYPGERIALGYSMGHTYQVTGGVIKTKLLAEPMRINATNHTAHNLKIEVHLEPKG